MNWSCCCPTIEVPFGVTTIKSTNPIMLWAGAVAVICVAETTLKLTAGLPLPKKT